MAEAKRSKSDPIFKAHTQTLQKAFAELDPSGKAQLSYTQVMDFLSTHNGKPFNRDIMNSLLQRMEKNQTSTLRSVDIIESYIDLEVALVSRIDELKSQNDALNHSATQIKRSEMKARANPKDPEVTSRTLFVEVIRATSISLRNGPVSAVVELVFEGQKKNTKVVPGPNPDFNEQFEFKIIKGTEPLKIELYDYANKELKGTLFMPMSSSQVGRRIVQNNTLMNSNGTPIETMIEFSILMADNKIQLYEFLEKYYREAIQTCRSEIDETTEKLETLQFPFRLTTERNMIDYNRAEFKQLDDMVTGRLDDFVKNNLGKNIEWGKVTSVSMYLFIFFSVFVMFARPDFFSMTLATVSFLLYVAHITTATHYKNLAILVAFSVVYDLVWLLFVGTSWLAGTYENEQETGLRRFAVVMTVLNGLFKLGMCVLLWRRAVTLNTS